MNDVLGKERFGNEGSTASAALNREKRMIGIAQ